MGCELDKVVEAINKVAGEVKDSRAINQLNELKNDLTKFATSMGATKPVRDFSKLRNVMNNVEVKAATTKSNVKVVNNLVRPEFDKLMNIPESKKKDAIIAPINSKTARKIQGCNK